MFPKKGGRFMEKLFNKVLLYSCLSIFVSLGPCIVEAQDFPTKPITLVNPGGAGGGHDLTARAVTSVAFDYLGQPILIKLMPGGGGSIGSDYVAKAQPDGYTLCWGGPGWSTTLPAVEGKSKGPDDLVAVCRVNYGNGIIIARPDAPYKNLKELVEWGNANPGKLVLSTSGAWGGADLAWKAIVKATGIQSKIVPYDGYESVLAVLGGHADFTIFTGPATIPSIKAGKLVALAVCDDKRDRNLPGTPTAKELLGYDLPYKMWRAALAPKGTPRPNIEKLAGGFKKMVENKSVISMINQFGDDIQYLGPDEFTKVWREEYETHKELGKFFKK
jgi:tripartite-type tricarboxylate transporter receptor subunit TctC